jgi:hypothetical protein
MAHAKRLSKRKRRGGAVPVLGAAGLLALASAAPSAGAAAEPSTQNARVSHPVLLGEEEISDVSLATFYLFDKEGAGPFGAGGRLIRVSGCCEFACLAGQAASGSNVYSPQVPYSPQVGRPIGPARKPARKRP